MITYITSGSSQVLYKGSNFYCAVEWFKAAVANGWNYVELKSTRDGIHFNLMKTYMK